MKFITQVINASSYESNLITDGQLSCSYQEIIQIFVNIDKLFDKWGIGKEDCFALACDNSIPSALVLLYLLEKDYSILLLPKAVKSSGSPPQDLPQFCRYSLATETHTQDGNLVNLREPLQFIQLAENEKCLKVIQKTTQKLYLKTSGSTGTPKMVMHSHSQLRGNVLNCVQRLNLQSSDRVAIPVPLYHMYGLGAAFLPSVAVGASIDLQKGANLLRYLQREQQFQPNVAFMTPIFSETLLKGRRSNREYKLTVAAGDTITSDTLTNYETRMGCLVKLYGSTEMGAIAAASPDDPQAIRAQAVGKPMSGVQLRLVKSSVESSQEQQGVGELWCHHNYGFDGYVDNKGEAINATQDHQDGWFRTKDLAKISTDGYLDVLGRCDHSVNRDGLLVFFADVEKAIRKIAGIDTVVVVSQGKSQRGKGMVAYCVLAKGIDDLTEATIRSACFSTLPKRAIPDNIFLVDALPLLPNGKIDRQKLVAMSNEKVSTSNLVR
ncbi:MAG: acyl--CoA ligase [Symploca sp. SIO3E6]|nr:acyl--CoA ligase [Caldora sp. SIO3E6]